MNKLEKYPMLLDYLRTLRSYYEGAELRGLSQREAARRYLLLYRPRELSVLYSEGKELIESWDFPFMEISSAINYHFSRESEAREWLQELLEIIKTIEPRAGRVFVHAIPEETVKMIRLRYPNLYSFVKSEFKSPSYHDYLSGYYDLADEKIATRYAAVNSPKIIIRLIHEGSEMLLDSSMPWEEINIEAGKHLTEVTDFREWIKRMVNIFDSYLRSI